MLDAAGGVAALAQLLKLSPTRVVRWRTIPTEYAIEIEVKLGLARERARPDQTFTRRRGCDCCGQGTADSSAVGMNPNAVRMSAGTEHPG